jgi:hypothetical protein
MKIEQVDSQDMIFSLILVATFVGTPRFLPLYIYIKYAV